MLNSLVGIIASSGGAAGATASYESIASATGTGSSGTITFSSIPSTYVALQVRISAITNSDGEALRIRLNNDATTNYVFHRLYGDGTTVTADASITQNNMILSPPGSMFTVTPTVTIFDLHNYASTTQYKTARSISATDRNGSGGVTLYSHLWKSTSAVNEVKIYTDSAFFTTGTTVSLYGIKGA